MTAKDKTNELSLIGYGILGSAIVFLVYDVIHNILENGGLTNDVTYRLIAFVLAIFAGLLFTKMVPKIKQIKIEYLLIVVVVVCGIAVGDGFYLVSLHLVTIKADWSTYEGSGIIAVSGTVNSVLPNEKVLIQVFYPNGTLYNSTKVLPLNNSHVYVYNFSIKPLDYYATNVFTINATYAGITASTHLNIEQ